ncbi:MAG: rod shape-determining protein MreD [Rhodospirillaceae bacterium]|nr:rod shape-determining protein MreD [Rhodospirillaceae bacterium]
MLGENTWQRLDRAARHSTPGIVTVALTLAAVVPMQMPHFGPIAPLVPLMAIYYWAIHRPDLMPYTLVFAVGLLHDTLTGGPLGVHSLLFLAVHVPLARRQRLLAGRSFLVLWCGFLVVATAFVTVEWLVYSLYFMDLMPLEQTVFRALLTGAAYPLVGWTLGAVQRGFLRSVSLWRSHGP